MALLPCPECTRSVSEHARACPNCGYPFAPSWEDRLREAWHQGFRNAWRSAAAFPAVFLAVLLSSFLAEGWAGAEEAVLLMSSLLPWVFITSVWGLLGGMAAIAVAAAYRARLRPGQPLWGWSTRAVNVLTGAFTLLMISTYALELVR